MSFGNLVVLNGVDLTVAKARRWFCWGHRGRESVLIKHAIGRFEPDAGDVIVDGIRYRRRRRAGAGASQRGIRVPERGALRLADGAENLWPRWMTTAPEDA